MKMKRKKPPHELIDFESLTLNMLKRIAVLECEVELLKLGEYNETK